MKGRGVARHGSLEGEDPGVIGPVVWDRHCQKINEIRQGRRYTHFPFVKTPPCYLPND